MSSQQFMELCYSHKLDDVKALIDENPEMLCAVVNENKGDTPAHWFAAHGNIEMLQYMYDAIISLNRPQEVQEQMVQQAFGPARGGWSPFHVAVCSSVECIKFFVTNCGSERLFLEKTTSNGFTAAHYAGRFSNIEALELIIRNAPNGIGVLYVKCNKGETPLDKMKLNSRMRDHFTPERIKKLGYKRELGFLEKGFCGTGAFTVLVLSIIKDNIELQM